MNNVLDFINTHFEAISAITVALFALITAYAKADKSNKKELILELYPLAHDLVQKIAKETKTKKDDLFIETLDKMLASFGYKLDSNDIEGLKAIGSAHHQMVKAVRVVDTVGKSENGSEQ